MRMQRREFLALFGGAAAAWPLAARPQGSHKMRRVSVLLGLDENDPLVKARLRAFRLAMRDLGWIEGRNIEIEYRFTGTDAESIKRHVAEVIRLAPEVIVANTSLVMLTLRPATSTIPLVFTVVNDPVGQGFVSNLAHPGGNITGFSFVEPEIVGKWVSLLSDVKPDLSRIALMFNPDTAPYYERYPASFKATQSAVELILTRVRTEADVEQAIAGLTPDAGLVAAADPYIIRIRETILQKATQHRVPVIAPYRQFVEEGFLMSYGPDTPAIFRRSASYVDRILKGEKPADLPVQSPDKFELVVNLRTAKALGLTVRESFLLLADEVIE
jgi:putative tryptophan/tyrosine transport system substrate-binding protein